jgi:hypothetical protein
MVNHSRTDSSPESPTGRLPVSGTYPTTQNRHGDNSQEPVLFYYERDVIKFLFAISRSRAAELKAEKRLGGAIATFRGFCFLRAAQGSPPKAGQVIGCFFFWFVFFGQAKKMNR